MASSSKTIGCSREFADGSICNRPVVPVFGVYPEQCTSCAMRVCVTKDGYEAAQAIIEAARGRLRALTIAASVPGNPWRVHEILPRFCMLDKLEADLGVRKLMRGMAAAERLKGKRTSEGKLVEEPRRTSLGHMWRSIPQERAMQLKQSGFEVRYIGVAWQVKVS